jgi:hypothetical protein
LEWNDIGEETEDPVRGIHFDQDIMRSLKIRGVNYKVDGQVRDVLFNERVDDEALLVEAWQSWLENVAQLKGLDQSHEHPKRDFFVAVVQH